MEADKIDGFSEIGLFPKIKRNLEKEQRWHVMAIQKENNFHK